MYAFFDKHGKKLLAVASALLIVMFLLPSNFGHQRPTQQLGTLNGQPIDFARVRAYYKMYQGLQDLYVKLPTDRFERPLLSMMFEPQIQKMLSQDNGMTWYMLVHEAEQAGIVPPESEVERFASYILLADSSRKPVKYDQLKDTAQEAIKAQLRMLMAVNTSFARSVSAAKVSQPQIDDFVARTAQSVRARLIVFDTSEFAAQVPAPTDDELRTQFEAFASVLPGNPDPKSNPFGFGYRIPDRVRIQYLMLPEAELAQSVEKSMTPDAWEELARVYYLRHTAEFAEKPDDKKNPDEKTPATTKAAATQPVTFESVSDKVYAVVRKPLIEKQRQAVLNKIRQQMAADYQRASKNFTATTQETASASTSFGVPLNSYEYMLKLRDDVAKQFGITLTVGGDGNMVSEDELRLIPGLGTAILKSKDPESFGTPMAYRLIFDSLKPLLPADKHSAPGVIDLNQPTPPLTSDLGTYIVRVVAIEPSHAPRTMEDVRADVERDVRRRQGFGKAVEAARAVQDATRLTGLAAYNARPVITTEWFGPPPPQMPFPMPLPGVPEYMNSYSSELIEPIFSILRGVKSKNELPRQDIVKLQAHEKVVLAELFDVQTRLSTLTAAYYRQQVADALQTESVTAESRIDWFKPDAVRARVGYVDPDPRPKVGGNSDEPKMPLPQSPIPG
jgi:hypothetical protein